MVGITGNARKRIFMIQLIWMMRNMRTLILKHVDELRRSSINGTEKLRDVVRSDLLLSLIRVCSAPNASYLLLEDEPEFTLPARRRRHYDSEPAYSMDGSDAMMDEEISAEALGDIK